MSAQGRTIHVGFRILARFLTPTRFVISRIAGGSGSDRPPRRCAAGIHRRLLLHRCRTTPGARPRLICRLRLELHGGAGARSIADAQPPLLDARRIGRAGDRNHFPRGCSFLRLRRSLSRSIGSVAWPADRKRGSQDLPGARSTSLLSRGIWDERDQLEGRGPGSGSIPACSRVCGGALRCAE